MTNPPTRHILGNVTIPPALSTLEPDNDGWCRADVVVDGDKITAVTPVGEACSQSVSDFDAKGSILLSAMVDCHTHLDKAHVAAFHTFPAGDLLSAIEAMTEYKQQWTAETLTQRAEFSLQSAYAYGVRAMRSHVDFSLQNAPFVWEVMTDAQSRWRGRVDLQLSPLAGITFFEDDALVSAISAAAKEQGCLGIFVHGQPNMEDLLYPIFEMAIANQWDLDFHVDEGTDPKLNDLAAIANVAQNTGFKGTVLCGHCVALSLYPSEQRDQVIAAAKQAGLHFVSLPLSNLYLQSRDASSPPVLRGIAPVSLMVKQGLTVSLGADNVRDGFCAFGDFDPLAVLGIGAQVAHLHEPARDWISLVTTNPSKTMGLDWDGVICAGAPADLVLLSARNSSEFNMRNTVERRVMREGNWIDATLPPFSNLNRDGKIDAT
ncbi:MAG: amidohydrolase family protein [Rhodobacteraceae bacterium]|nr:amidohydrolase family protein [Paracoccaceae bacterium]